MKHILKYLYVAAIALTFAGCSFLDREPYDEFTDSEFWQTEDQARTFMYGFYTSVFSGYGTGTAHGPFLMGQTLNDDFSSDVSQNNLQPEVVPESDGAWSFTNVRKANYVLENIDRIDASGAAKNHWRGVARFFRACYYSNLVFTFGDVPWYDRVPASTDLDYLYKDRDRRTFVDSCIMADFRYAMDSVRVSDGAMQVNKYVVAGMASRFMLREGTYLKYHYGTDPVCAKVAEECLLFAKNAALEVIKSGKYSIAPSYNALFTSEDLAGNPEVLIYRHYSDGVLTHSTLAYSYTESQAGVSKSLAEAFLCTDGRPVYVKDPFWTPRTADKFFKDRDPRLNLCIRYNKDKNTYYVKGENCQPYAYALSGYSWNKFMNDEEAEKLFANNSSNLLFNREKNVTDAPCLRYAEVLLNYVEAAYELHDLKSSYPFTQDDIDMSVNVIRDRLGVNMPHLGMSGENPTVGGMVYDDPVRLQLETRANGAITSSLLWELRRERRVELCLEGFRLNDLKRWGKLDYVWNDCNPDIRFGAYIVATDYPNKADEVVLVDAPDADISAPATPITEGYILRNTQKKRDRPVERNYISPVPSGQILLYENHGYHLSQTKEWQ